MRQATFTYSAAGAQAPSLPAAGTLASRWIPFALVFGAVTFNLFLCFVNTSFAAVGNFHVIAFEALIISLVLLATYRSMEQVHVLLLAVTAFWALTLASLRVVAGTDEAIDVKIVRDLVIPITFFLLGTRVASLRDADFIVTAIAAVVFVVGLFEYFWLDTFTKFFSVAKYYIARGTMEARQAMQSADLFISGIRPAGAEGGRNLLPFLFGDHRVSSVFLEPVSLGNFGVIVFMWGLVRSKFTGRLYLGLMGMGLAVIILSDSRFGAYLCGIALLVILFPLNIASLGLMALPVVALATLTIVPFLITGSYDPQNRYVDNGFVGRFVLSGQILSEFDVWTWFGLSALKRQAFDSGYAYILGGIGVIGLAAAWLMLFAIKGPDRQFYLFRNLAAVYYGTILCVSNSPFTIKTASLLWVLIGALATSPREATAVSGSPPWASGFARPRRLGRLRLRT